MVDLDLANSRMKDFYDIWTCSRYLEFDGATLAKSIAATFERRATPLPTQPPTAFTAVYFAAEAHQRQWDAFVRRIRDGELAGRFADVVAAIADFVMAPTLAVARGAKFRRRWQPGGPWN
jgi:hypothetical protein